MLANRVRMAKVGSEEFVTEWISANDGNLVDLEFDGKKIMDPQIRFEGVNINQVIERREFSSWTPEFPSNCNITYSHAFAPPDYYGNYSSYAGTSLYVVAYLESSIEGAIFNVTVTAPNGTYLFETTITTEYKNGSYNDSKGDIIVENNWIEEFEANQELEFHVEPVNSGFTYKLRMRADADVYRNYDTVDPRIIIGSTPTGYTGTLSGGNQTAWYNIADFVNGSTQLNGEIDVGGSDKLKYQIRGTLK